VRARRRAEWERALSARRSASERLQISLSHRTVALETLRIEQRKYAEGQGTITEVLEAEAAALETKSLIATARADFFVSLAHYDFAAGSFFQAGARHPSLRAALRSDASTPFLIEQP
jgi:outer membrane protein TolC